MTGEDQQLRMWTVRGVVQGVGFRMFVLREATALGLIGTVRNTRDDSVEVVAAGTLESLEQLEQRLLTGPPMSDVQSVEADEFKGDASDFHGRFMVIG